MFALLALLLSVVHVGGSPTGIAVGSGSLWTANGSSATVSRIDPVGRTVTATIRVGVLPSAIGAGGDMVWVGDFGASAVYRIDPASNAIVATVQLGSNVDGVAVAPDGSVWVSEYSGNAVDRIDPATNTVVEHIELGGPPGAIAFAAGKAWVANGAGYVTPIDLTTNEVGARLTVAHDVDALVVTPQGIWAATYDGGRIALIDPVKARVVRKLPLRAVGGGIGFKAGALWVSDYAGGRILRISPRTGRVLKAVRVGSKPRDIVSFGGALWVIEEGSADVRRIPTG